MPRFSLLSDWLAWLETLHPVEIDLGLARVYQVAGYLDLILPPSKISHEYSGALALEHGTVFTIAGTNGKGSCVSTIEQCLLEQSLLVGSYTSPHLHHYSERIRINGQPVSDQMICDAFAAIDDARTDISLTYFEFATLAALWIFVQQKVPYVVLEVGLGGRLDAVNIIDADIAVVTSIAVDHEAWLGSDREKIAIEKLGVTRSNIPVVITESDPTQSLIDFSRAHNATQMIAHDFTMTAEDINQQWQWRPEKGASAVILPSTSLPLASVTAGLQALWTVNLLPSPKVLPQVVERLALQGRYQIGSVRQRQVIFDVAHNPAAAFLLAEKLRANAVLTENSPRTIAVFAVMEDKDISCIVEPMMPMINDWYCSPLADNERSASADRLRDVFSKADQVFRVYSGIEQAFDMALKNSAEHDRIVVFGSFFTVAAIQQYIKTL